MKKEKITLDNAKAEESSAHNKQNDFTAALVETSFETSFFYTNDKFIS